MSESIRTILEDSLAKIDSLEQYEANLMTQDAIERRIILIGEAIYRLNQMKVDLPFGDQLINRRNTIVHQYDDFNPETIWRSLYRELPPLKEEADRLLAE